MRIRIRVAAGVAVLAVFVTAVAACGGNAGETAKPAEETPARIVSLSPTATEMLFAIGAGDQVVAVDDQSNFPEEAPKTDLSAFKPNVEAIASYKPDLVVVSDAGGELADSLAKVKITTFSAPAATSLDDAYHQLRELGDITGHRAEAAKVVASMKQRLAAVAAAVPAGAKGATYYHELDPNYFSATSKTFIGSVYALLGLKNIADPADTAGGGYPQLSAEFIVHADPDVIFLADSKCCQQSAATVAARDGWAGIAAVRNGAVVALDDDIASRWGPRTVEFAEAVATSLTTARKAA
ncbi:MAG TPA: ABC transporter substrate-binding protein [Acidimicrobiales bacterium]|nr:ABC transporter substrate-binding protein [Acidimicrobiales bacterium]